MRSRSRPCRRPTLRRLRWPRRLRWFRQRKSIPTLASVANGKRNITRRQRPIMTPAGIRTRRAISGPRRTKSSSPAKDPTGAPRWRVFCCLCATTTAHRQSAGRRPSVALSGQAPVSAATRLFEPSRLPSRISASPCLDPHDRFICCRARPAGSRWSDRRRHRSAADGSSPA
jgi:hypothetical protein